MNTRQAKLIIKSKLDELKLPYDRLTARSIDFTDLARDKCIFVKIHGWKPNPAWKELETLAINNNFRIESGRSIH